MQVIEDLSALNDYMENQKLLTKLPDWLVSQWNREATKRMKEEKKYPDFKTYKPFSVPKQISYAILFHRVML